MATTLNDRRALVPSEAPGAPGRPVACAHGATLELTEAVARRRMTRNFSGRPLDPAVVDDLLTAALSAPSAGNTQGREFVVLEGSGETSSYWAATTDERWRAASRRYAGLARAPVVVLVFADPEAYVGPVPGAGQGPGRRCRGRVGGPLLVVDAAFATMNLLLAATDRGIGAAFLGNFRGEDRLRAALGVPERLRWLGRGAAGRGRRARPSVVVGGPAPADPGGERPPGSVVVGSDGGRGRSRSTGGGWPSLAGTD